MIDPTVIKVSLQAPDSWVDTPEQAQLRTCLAMALEGHDGPQTIRICRELITLMRDQLMTGAARVRRQAAREARQEMSPKDLAAASGETRQTISRLLTEARET
jgi:hypothetical protein